MRGKATQLFRNKAKDKMVSPNSLEAAAVLICSARDLFLVASSFIYHVSWDSGGGASNLLRRV